MIDREKVIKALECCQMVYECKPYEKCPYSNGYECGDCDINQLHYDALALLKEQEAVKPIRKKLKFSETWECGNCHEELFEGEVIRDNYCPNCGRSVKWE